MTMGRYVHEEVLQLSAINLCFLCFCAASCVNIIYKIAGYKIGGGEGQNWGAPIQFMTVDYLLVRLIHDPDVIKVYLGEEA